MEKEYTSVCDTCGGKTWYEQVQPCKRTISRGWENCGSHENISEQKQCTGMLRLNSEYISYDNSDLILSLAPYYKSGERVEITYKDGENERCYIGKSTGWKPVYLCIKYSNSTGGSVILGEIKSIRGLGKYNK